MTRAGSAPRRILELAARRGAKVERLPMPGWADKVSELTGDAVAHDPVEDLFVTL